MGVVTRSAEFLSNGQVNCRLSGLGLLVFVTLKAKVVASHPQEYVGLVFVTLDRVAGVASGVHSGMHDTSFGLVLMTGNAFGEIWTI